MNTPTVAIYSTPTCHYCHLTKDFLAEKGIAYTDYNVAEDQEKRKEMIELTGQMGVPVIQVNNQLMIGFDEEALSKALGIAV